MGALRILVVGAGAIGGITAAKLAGSVADIAVLDGDPQHVALLRQPGLLLDDLGIEKRVPLTAHTDAAQLDGRFDFALIAVKSGAVRDALEPIRDRDLADCYVSLGNGLVQEQIQDLVGRDRLVVGITQWGATNLGPGRLARTTSAPFIVGEPDGASNQRIALVAELLENIDEVHVTDNIWGHVWSKLLVNSTFSGLGTVAGMHYGEVTKQHIGREAAFHVWSEGFKIAQEAGVELEHVLGIDPEDLALSTHQQRDRANAATDRIMSRVAATKPSMLQDVERGRRSEVDVINGALVKKASEHGMDAPANAWIVRTIHAMERGELTPDGNALHDLASAIRT